MIKLEEILDKANKEYESGGGSLRYGQCLWNVACETREVEHLRGTDVDPFYRNERIPAFIEELKKIFKE